MRHACRAPRSNEPGERVLQLLQDDRVLYNDQPIAVVVADTLENAQHAASLVRAVVRAREAAAGPRRCISPRPTRRRRRARGPTDTHTGDFDRAYATAAYRINATYTTPVHNHNPMEPHGTIAVWNAADRVTVYDSTQGITGVRKRIAKLFGLPLDGVRVISLFVGGGFGCKGTPWSHVPLAVMAARVLGRPVKLVLTRHQMFSLVGHRPVTRQQIALGADGRGRLVAMRHDVVAVTSRFDEFVEPSAAQTRMSYACPNIRTSHRLVRLDVSTPTFTRAPGEASGSFALESAMDELSYALKLDPLELRLRNYAERDPESGKPFSSKSLRACYAAGGGAIRVGAPARGGARDAQGARVGRLGHGDRDLPGGAEPVAGGGAHPRRRHRAGAGGDAGSRHRHVHHHEPDRRRCAGFAGRARALRARRHAAARGAAVGGLAHRGQRRPRGEGRGGGGARGDRDAGAGRHRVAAVRRCRPPTWCSPTAAWSTRKIRRAAIRSRRS